MSVEGRAARDGQGRVIERRVPIDGLGTAYIRPLQYGDSIRFFENRERTPRRLAALFRRTVAGFETCSPADVRQMVAGLPTLLEFAIVRASGLLQTDQDMADESDEDGVEIPEDSLMAPEPGSPAEEATATLDEIEEADVVEFLHRKGYTMSGIYALLPVEIEVIRNGHRRQAKRGGGAWQSGGAGETGTANPFDAGADEPPPAAPGFR